MRPLSAVAQSFDGDLEAVVIVAHREDFEAPYAVRCDVPRRGARRAEGLELVFARAATVAVAIVGTAQLRIACASAPKEVIRLSFESL